MCCLTRFIVCYVCLQILAYVMLCPCLLYRRKLERDSQYEPDPIVDRVQSCSRLLQSACLTKFKRHMRDTLSFSQAYESCCTRSFPLFKPGSPIRLSIRFSATLLSDKCLPSTHMCARTRARACAHLDVIMYFT